MTSIDVLLQPVSEEQPCGQDLTYDSALQELDSFAKGKPETQFSPAEEPNWKELRTRAETLFLQSKDLRIAMILTLALLKTEGLPGFQTGLALVRGLLERYWNQLYPKLDPDDNNDPLERVNTLAWLITPLGTFDDPTRFLQRLTEAPVCDSPRLGSFGLADIKPSSPPLPGKTPRSPSEVQAAFRDTDPAKLTVVAEAVANAIADVKQIDAFLDSTISASRAPDWSPLVAILADIQKTVTPFLPVGAPGAAEAGTPEAEGASGAAASGPPGAIRSRRDVIDAIDRICTYYAQSEPSSPVPFLLRRARRLVDSDFMQIIGDLTPEALNQLRSITGQQSEGEAGSSS